MNSRTLLLLIGLMLLGATAVHAQSRTTAALRGTVVRESGEPVADAVIQLRHEGTGAVKEALTDGQGRFMMLQVQPGGPYRLTVRAFGFEEHSVTGIMLQVGDVFPVEVTLRFEAIDVEGVTVAVEADRMVDIFDPSQVGPATRIGERTIEALPILSRNVMEITNLSPLVRTTEGGGFSVAGQNDRYNTVLVDGLLSQDMFGLTSGALPGGQAGAKLIPIDAVAQFEILVAPYDVRLSGFTGGVMNAVTRTGTNEWLGRVTGVHRNEALIGDLSLPTGPVDASTVDRSLLAFSLGGPLVRDRLHVFTAGEFERRRQPPNGFNLFRDDASLVRISEERIDSLSGLLSSGFGIDAGDAGPYPLEQELANVFTRFDLNLAGGDRVTLRHIFAHAANDEPPNREFFEPYELSSNAVFRSSTSHIAALQHFMDLGRRFANELKLTFQHTVDRTTPASELPQIEVGLVSSIDDVGFQRYARTGGQFYAHLNDLEQTSLRLTNSLDMTVGDDVMTFGVAGGWFGFRNAFLPGSRGEYLFPSLSDLDRNAPYRYQRTELAEGEPEAVEFDVAEVGAFVQRQINAGKGLTMHFGIRADVPWVIGRPERNIDLEARYGYDTSRLPSGNVLISPRWGFNWQSGGERNTQVRGGAGVFSGHIPYVWLANAFHENGLRSVTLVCEGRAYVEPRPIWAAPAYVPEQVPASCDRASESFSPFITLRNAVVFENGFRYPQDIRFSAIVDRELTDRISASVGFLFNTAVNQVGIEDLNVAPGAPQSEQVIALGGLERWYYDTVDDAYQHILVVTNEGQNVAASGTVELRGALTDRVGFQAGYSYAHTADRTSLVHTDMMSNFGSTPAEADVNRPPLADSNFDRPHKIVAAVFGAPIPALPETEISLFYQGQSGLPFSYVYWGDINGDGFPGLGGAFDRTNDLIHIPRKLSDAPMSFVTQGLFASAIEHDDCLAGNVGSTLNRNECRAPWEHRLDLRVTQGFDVGGASVRLEADVLNVLSLIKPEWGRVERTSPLVPLLDLCVVACELQANVGATWAGGVLPRRTEEGRLVPSDPWTVVTPESQWRMQVGARISFGRDDR